jgi:hypothetical protein
MKYIKLFLKCFVLLIVFIPLGYLYSVINKEVSLYPSKNECILIIVSSIGGTIFAFIVELIKIRKRTKIQMTK